MIIWLIWLKFFWILYRPENKKNSEWSLKCACHSAAISTERSLNHAWNTDFSEHFVSNQWTSVDIQNCFRWLKGDFHPVLITGQVKFPNLQHAIYECLNANTNATWKSKASYLQEHIIWTLSNIILRCQM